MEGGQSETENTMLTLAGCLSFSSFLHNFRFEPRLGCVATGVHEAYTQRNWIECT